MKKSTSIALISAFAIGAVGLTVGSPAFARKQNDQRPRLIFQEIDTNGDGKITAEELASHREAGFSARDADGDGFLSKEEMLAAALAKAAEKMSARIDHVINRRDKDADGRLSFTELSNDKRSKRIFSRLDQNDDGTISASELEEAQNLRRAGKKRRPISE